MKEFNPKVSIIIPVFNGANYLREAIESAINQSYKNIEIIVVNDGSNDNGETERIALEYKDKIKYYKKENGGVASALNLGIEKMEGEYFSWLSHDDLYEKTKVENQIKILATLNNIKTLICCRYKVVDKDLNYIQENNYGEEKDKLIDRPIKYLLKGYVHGCCLLIHKEHFERAGNFNETLKTTQDFDMWFRMLRGQKIYFNNDIGVISRAHEEQDSRKLFDYHLTECDELLINMAKELTVEEKIKISGTVCGFYKEVYDFLHLNTPYKGCVEYLKNKFFEELLNELEKGDMTKDFLEFLNYKDVEKIELREELQSILNSKSWKITSPLRKITTKIKKGKNNLIKRCQSKMQSDN